MKKNNKTFPRQSWTFDEYTNSEIRRAAETGIYDIRGGGSKRRLPHFDDLLFLGASISRYPLEGYREKCSTNVILGTRFAKNPLQLKIPITNTSGQSSHDLINSLTNRGIKVNVTAIMTVNQVEIVSKSLI